MLGFCDADGYGTYGLEKSYESTLAGVNGRTITLRNAYGNAIADENATTYAAKDGSNLVLSLDVNVQEVVERYLNEAIAANNVENRGAAIVMNVKTGAILAMASKPDFDPNDPLNYTANEAYLNELVHAEPELYGVYLKNEDGSYVTDATATKFLTRRRLLRLLPRHPVEEQDHHRAVLPRKRLQGHHGGHGCGLRQGDLQHHPELLRRLRRRQGDLPLRGQKGPWCAESGRGPAEQLQHLLHPVGPADRLQPVLRLLRRLRLYRADRRGPAQRDQLHAVLQQEPLGRSGAGLLGLRSGHGGDPAAGLHRHLGSRQRRLPRDPACVDKITDQNGNVIEEVGANVRRQVISESASETIRQIMEYEVADGTQGGGGRAYVAGYRIGGKSGTSEQLNMDRRSDGDYKKVASFAAVLPANDPEILVYVMLDDPNNAKTDYSSILAAPVVGNIISEIAPYLASPPTALTAAAPSSRCRTLWATSGATRRSR